MAVDKELLFKSRLSETTYEVPGVGEFTIRALSRTEVMGLQNSKLSIEKMERKLVSMAVVDPELTEDEVGQWQDASEAGELEGLSEAIMTVSGMDVEAAKDSVKQFRS